MFKKIEKIEVSGADKYLENRILELKDVSITNETFENISIYCTHNCFNSEFIGVKFINVNFDDTIFMNCVFRECKFENCTFNYGLIFSTSILSELEFINCKFNTVNIEICNTLFGDVNFTNSIMNSLNVFATSLFNSHLNNVKILKDCVVNASHLDETKINNSFIEHIDIKDSKLYGLVVDNETKTKTLKYDKYSATLVKAYPIEGSFIGCKILKRTI